MKISVFMTGLGAIDLILIAPCMQSMTSPFTKLEEAIYIIKV